MKDKSRLLKVGIDLDDTITYCPSFFSIMTDAMQDTAEIHIITDREQTPESKAGIRKELDKHSIQQEMRDAK